MPSSVSATLAPFGGVVVFNIGGYATGLGAQMVVSRSSTGSGGSFLNIFSGATGPLFMDYGDGLPTALLSGSTYYWNFTDASGTVQSGPITPTGSIQYLDDSLTETIIRCLQSGIDNQGIPAGIKRAVVIQDMPLNGFPDLPLITVTAKLEEQEYTGIGQQIPYPIAAQNQTWSQGCLSRKVWTVSCLCTDTTTRDYYKRLVVLIFQAMLPNIFQNLGQNVSHRYMINTGQTAKDLEKQIPGFYFADIMLEVTGNFTINIQTNYPTVSGILIGITASGAYSSSSTTISVSGLN